MQLSHERSALYSVNYYIKSNLFLTGIFAAPMGVMLGLCKILQKCSKI